MTYTTKIYNGIALEKIDNPYKRAELHDIMNDPFSSEGYEPDFTPFPTYATHIGYCEHSGRHIYVMPAKCLTTDMFVIIHVYVQLGRRGKVISNFGSDTMLEKFENELEALEFIDTLKSSVNYN